ncbi:TolC family protein [bacterium]|nr:TolC family protein [bacterium]
MKIYIGHRTGAVFVVLLFAIAFGQQAQSYSQNGTVMTLAEAESLLSERNNDIKVARAQYEQAAANYLSAWSSFLPTAGFSANWRRYDHQMISIRNDQFIYSRDSYSLGLSADFPLFSGGRDLIALKEAKLSADISRLAYEDTRRRMHYQLVQAYFNFVRAAMQLEIARQSLARIQDEQKIVQKKYSLGSASEMDLSRIRVQVAQKQFALVQAENNFDRARENLCAMLSLPLDTLIYPDTTYLPKSAGEIPPVEHFLDRYKHNNSWRQASLDLKIKKLDRLSSFLAYLPRVSLSGSWGWSGGETPQSLSEIRDDGSASFGLSLSWTLFSGTSRIGTIKRSAASLEAAKNSLNKSTISVQRDIREAYRMMVEAVESYNLATVQIEDARLNLETVQKRYELGSATLLELLDGELALEQAQLQRINAIADYYTYRAQLEWLAGK